jgi:hypothetical protein
MLNLLFNFKDQVQRRSSQSCNSFVIIITYRRDIAETRKTEKETKKKKEEEDRKKAEEMRKAAVERLAS